MINKTNIQWTDYTWNIARGCDKVDADCKYCYMYRQSLNKTRYNPNEVVRTKSVFKKPLTIKEPSKIFVSSLTDVFHPAIDSYRHEMWEIIRQCPQHTFQILTKRPERILEHLPADWGDGWDNVWLGTSIGSNETKHERLLTIIGIPAKVRFLSLEPLYGPVTLYPVMDLTIEARTNKPGSAIDWVIVGGESGNDTGKYRYRECELYWIHSIVSQCHYSGVPVFVKQLGTHLAKKLNLKDRHGGDISEWPKILQVRQFPNV